MLKVHETPSLWNVSVFIENNGFVITGDCINPQSGSEEPVRGSMQEEKPKYL